MERFWELVRDFCRFAWGCELESHGELRKVFGEEDGVLRFS
jgi:hypothetical protein